MIAIFCLATYSCKQGAGSGSSKNTTLNGFKYQLLNDAPGETAKEGDYVYFRYNVKNNDSIIFSSTSQVPLIKFKLPKLDTTTDMKKAIPISELLYKMSKSDSAVVYQKLDEATKASIGLKDATELTFEVYLDNIKDEAAYKADMEADQKAAQERADAAKAKMPEIESFVKTSLANYKSKKAKINTTASGLKYVIHEEGTGAKAEAGKTVSVNYFGALISDGTRFDDSFSRGDEFSFPLGAGQVIPGWDEGIALLKEGSKASFFIPYTLAYGEAGSPPVIPAKADLMFYVELNKVK